MIAIENISSDNITAERFGGKAAGLALLYKYGYTIPRTLVIEACRDIKNINTTEFKEALLSKLTNWRKNSHYCVAIRSSCTIEDAFINSMAGHFNAFIGEMTFNEIIENINKIISGLSSINANDAKMGIVLQEKINAEYSGVLFSSDPFSYSKKTMHISFVSGIGIGLVSGIEAGKDIVVSVQEGGYLFSEQTDPKLFVCLLELLSNAKKLEQKLNYPLDFEWAILDDNIYFLQCRPLTSITKIPSAIQLINNQNLRLLPQMLVSHDKVNLRLSAQASKMMVSDAYIYMRNLCIGSGVPSINLLPSQYCKGYSAVIIYPQRLSDKVIRSFVGDKQKVLGTISDCCRYGIRSFPKYKNLEDCLNNYSDLVSEEYWISATIIQEVFDPLYTGVIRRISNGFLIEITRGHFLTKGIVPTSQYVINEQGHLLFKEEVRQRQWLKIIEGHVVICICNEGENDIVSLNNERLLYIVEYFKGSLKTETAVVEFGILKEATSDIQPYLIDFVDDNSCVSISVTDMNEGIISRGHIVGKTVHVKNNDFDSLDTHFYNTINSNVQNEENVVFFCEKPNISLLFILEKYNSQKIGFVFQEGSVLCHFAIVLREKGIPAIRIGDILNKYNEGDICTIDAMTPNIPAKERLIK
jgi:phosphohistidine swiveling domain-containing protein